MTHVHALPKPRLQDATHADLPALLTLNQDHVEKLSPLSSESLAQLHHMAAYHRVVWAPGAHDQAPPQPIAFLLALREGCDYASPNYRWFATHRSHFLYIDRVVVATSHQGRGLGSMLYQDLFAWAKIGQTKLGSNLSITCEFDLEPPNPASARFHQSMGFAEVGRQTLPSGKQVSLQERA